MTNNLLKFLKNMIYKINNYFCTNIPTEEDVEQVLKIAKEENVFINLKWWGPAHGYYGDDEHSIQIRSTHTKEQIMNSLPKIYGI